MEGGPSAVDTSVNYWLRLSLAELHLQQRAQRSDTNTIL